MTTIINGTTDAITFPDGTIQTTAAQAAFASGTVVLFYQAAAPTGWTQVTTQNNKALRVVSGSGGVAGGSVAFTTAFASQTPAGSVSITAVVGTAGATTLTTPQIPSHSHSIPGGPYSSPNGVQGQRGGGTGATTDNTGGGGSHDHPFSFTSGTGTFSGTDINLAVQYIDIIIASKN